MDRVRLWLSYQRYALCALGLPPILVATAAYSWPGAWWAWGPLALIGLRVMSFGLDVGRRLPQKFRATWLADRRIARARFRPESIIGYCGDPCFRVVAHEILRRAGWADTERKAAVRRFRAEALARAHVTVLVDRRNGVVYEIDGNGVRRRVQGEVEWQVS